MKIIHGPTYRYQGERLTAPNIIVVQDHHFDPASGYALQRLLDESTCPPHQHLLVFDHILVQDEFSKYPHVCLPLLMAAECMEFNSAEIVPVWGERDCAFNFMINKPRLNRLLLLDMVHDLALSSYRHSLCWIQDYKSITATNYTFGDEIKMDQGIRSGSHKNSSNYREHLKRSIFERSCVSLITEPGFHERETIITEKTIMAIWGGTLPIWVGGWRCAEVMKQFGFDVFEDVVDHSYQTLPDPVDRCRQAIERNRHLLDVPMDLSLFSDRLTHNLVLLQQNVFLTRICDILQAYPQLKPVVQTFRNGLLGQR